MRRLTLRTVLRRECRAAVRLGLGPGLGPGFGPGALLRGIINLQLFLFEEPSRRQFAGGLIVTYSINYPTRKLASTATTLLMQASNWVVNASGLILPGAPMATI